MDFTEEFRSIVSKAKDFLQNLIREHDMPPKPVLEIDDRYGRVPHHAKADDKGAG